jgi:23S rRNA-/tRNA-specific pseudouridylate synthase
VTAFKRLAVATLQSRGQESMAGQITADGSSGFSYSLLLVTPITGRMHQIRAHLNHIGHPLDGDGRCTLTINPSLLIHTTMLVKGMLRGVAALEGHVRAVCSCTLRC